MALDLTNRPVHHHREDSVGDYDRTICLFEIKRPFVCARSNQSHYGSRGGTRSLRVEQCSTTRAIAIAKACRQRIVLVGAKYQARRRAFVGLPGGPEPGELNVVEPGWPFVTMILRVRKSDAESLQKDKISAEEFQKTVAVMVY